MRFLLLVALLAAPFAALFAAGSPIPPARADVYSYAILQDDASLRISGKTVRLYGIYIPESERICRTFIRPSLCASRAVLALDFKIQGFVHCVEKVRYTDGSIGAVCRVGRTYHWEGEDLGAYLLREGWAVATPDAPFEYKVLEDIARTRGRGVWGFQVDSIR